MGLQSRREFLKNAALGTAGAALPFGFSLAGSSRKPKRPNILFFFPDQHRFDWLGTNPLLPLKTPNLNALAERGVRFTRAFCPSPLCAPSRASIASGKEYDRCGVENNKFDYPLSQTTFYERLRDTGYHVAGCGKFDLHKGSPTWGLNGKHLLTEWGFSDGIDNAGKWDAVNNYRKDSIPKDPYMAFLKEKGLAETHVADFLKRRASKYHAATFPTPLPEDGYCDNWIGKNGLDLMKDFPEDKSWFLQVNFAGPHDPWDITERMDEISRGRDFPQPNRCEQFTPEEHVAVRQNYSAMVENIDRWLGIYVEELRMRNELDNTLVLCSSDHGEMLGDHNLWAKNVPYQPSVGVPLIIAGPGVQKGFVSDALVSTMDLHATFLDFAGVPRPDDLDSLTLTPLLKGETDTHRQFVSSGLDEWRLVFDGHYKLIRGFVEPMLFDLENDPLENKNIAGSAPEVIEQLSRFIISHRRDSF